MFVHRHAKVTAEQSPDQLRGEKMGDCCHDRGSALHCRGWGSVARSCPIDSRADRTQSTGCQPCLT